ncbi:UvrD-helicase domain-containing protein [Dyella sp.]|jgi:exodeoxyribonuclease V beta subunit|uniref:UvrD-helicase domain-containing protein n=1 Tax=Dyella sp. TaxID=1869338 RepID=UPI002D7A1AC4|nr:UvrD-helicase domain-containing protein [Dyella sp.]HET6431148.1 UvrD-helicase domain-containing protein [Dyella sp.]
MNAAASTPALDWTRLALAGHGRTLIEASAGTGKTWTIAVLYLRLLLEQGLSPRQVVVTTFTDAAAQELRERLRAKLVWGEMAAEDWLAGRAAPAPAPDRAWLQARWQHDRADAERDRLRLRLAQAELDMAPVGTLHGLCRRILGDYPFESGAGFQLGEMVAADALLDEWAADLWRRLQQGDRAVAAAPASLAALRRLLKAYLQPGVALWTPDAQALEAALPAAQADTLEAFAQEKSHFLPRKSALKNALLALASWLRDRDEPLKPSALANLLAAETDAPDQLQPETLASPATRALLGFASRAGRVLEYAAEADHVQAWQDWLAQVGAWRAQRLAARAQLTFDELIGRVGEALRREDRALADRLHAAWPVALVDEFQDTDGQQYDILRAIYSDAAGAARGRLVMIGDPKQAIYRFRGGDIDTYLRAARAADEVLRLDTNHRSSRALVAAINQFYAVVGPVLSTRDDAPIRYEAVHASARRDGEVYTVGGTPLAQPLQLHLRSDCPAAVPARSRLALEACAQQIAALLQAGTHRIGDAPVQPGDIAVLLPGNQDITDLRGLLQRHGVPCVGAGRSSVFALDLARELQIVLYGIDHASDEGAVRAALATRLYGMSFHALKALREQPEAWLTYEQQFQQWRVRWQREGVLAVVRALIDRAAPTLLAGEDGERALTDLRHLGELLQAQSEKLHGSEQLLAWFARQREGEAAGGDAAEEQQLRIESDARRVRLMTLHASKGLEFPIVFLPLMWDHTRSGQDTTPVIDEPLCGQRVIGFGKAAKAQYDREGQDERFRVLYVALTRAIHACHVYVLPPDRPKQANSDKPAGDPERAPLDASVGRLLARLANGLVLADEAPQLAWLPDGWPWRASGRIGPDAADDRPRRVLPMPSAHPDARVYSFSTLTRGAHAGTLEDSSASDESPAADDVEPGLDAVLPAPAPDHPELLALAPIRGADIGNALHAMFENRVIGEPMTRQLELVDRELRAFGVPLEERERGAVIQRLARRLQGVLDTALLPGLTLGSLPPARQLAEMEFHYVLDDTSVAALREACVRHGQPTLVPFTAVNQLRGRMTGKIDLIIEHDGRYGVLDYKSNYLGDRLDGYMPDALEAAMDAHQYRFQALLYTVAVDRMLRQRLPGYRRERHLGEAIYLFVRAVGLAPAAGIWRHRFDDGLIAAVDAALAGHMEGAVA